MLEELHPRKEQKFFAKIEESDKLYICYQNKSANVYHNEHSYTKQPFFVKKY